MFYVCRRMYNMGCRNSIALQVKQLVPPIGSDGHENRSWVCRLPNRISLLLILFLRSSKLIDFFSFSLNIFLFATLKCTDPLRKIIKKSLYLYLINFWLSIPSLLTLPNIVCPWLWTEILRILPKQYRQIKMCAIRPFLLYLLSSKT